MITLFTLASRLVVFAADPTPTPYPAYRGDENLITPGIVGFAVTFFVAAATVLLLVDMSRRMRRVRYRSEIRDRLEGERMAADAAGPSAADPGAAGLGAADSPKPKNG